MKAVRSTSNAAPPQSSSRRRTESSQAAATSVIAPEAVDAVIKRMRVDWLLPKLEAHNPPRLDGVFHEFFEGYRALSFGMALMTYLKSRGATPILRVKVHGLYTNHEGEPLACTPGTLRIVHCAVTIDGEVYFDGRGDCRNQWRHDFSNATYMQRRRGGYGLSNKPMKGTTLCHWYRTENPRKLMTHLRQLDPLLPFLPELEEAVGEALAATSDKFLARERRLSRECGQLYPWARLGRKTRVPPESDVGSGFSVRLAPHRSSGSQIDGQPIDVDRFPWRLALKAPLKAAA